MTSTTEATDWLLGSSKMGEIIRSNDWSAHVLGPIESWPQSLKTALGICLNSKFPMLVWWGKDLLVFYNDTYIPFAGQKHPQYIGRPAREQWSEIWDSLGPLTEQVLRKGKATWAESMCLFMNRSGFLEETYFTFSYSPIIDETGKVVGIINPCQETTEQILSERRLKSLKDIGAKEVKSVLEAGMVLGQILTTNNPDIPFSLLYFLNTDKKTLSLVGLSGLEKNTIISPTTIDISKTSNFVWPMIECYQDRKPIKINELRHHYASCLPKEPYEECPDAAYMLPITSMTQEEPLGFLILGISPRLMFDERYESYFQLICKQKSLHISNILALEDQRRRVNELSELNHAKTDFFNNVSHELRTPLTLILGYLEKLLANNSSLTFKIRSELDVVYRNAVRLLKLVNNLLDFSRLESNRMQISFEPTDLSQLTMLIASSFTSAIETAGLNFVVECSPLADNIYVDKEMWENIVFNLLSNAFKYTLKGSIKLSLKIISDHIELSVSDTGIGIPENEQTKIFDRFHRVMNAEGRTHEGTGIGLALVKELVDLHKGVINVNTQINKGSTFTVSIPTGKDHIPQHLINKVKTKSSQSNKHAFIQEAHRLSDETLSTTTNKISSHNKMTNSIILAEDNPDMRDYIFNLLADQYNVAAYENGKLALEAIVTHPPNLIISDVMMPVMDGKALINHIRSDKKIANIPIILLSARAEKESTITGIESGADDYLVKPFSANELLARVKQHIAMFNLRNETNQLKDKFLASITHELRSPLNAIIGFVSLIHDEKVGSISANQKEYLGYVLTNSEHLLHLINELLDLAKIEAGKIEFSPEKIDLKRLADEVTGTLKSLVIEKNIHINVILEGQANNVTLDRGRLKQVLYNYISNAIKFTPANGSITVRLLINKSQLTIEVEDTGIGITQEKISQLFVDFHQVSSDPNLNSSGTGLGLALTKRIVEAQGGTVTVKSQPGKGSTFSAIIPLNNDI